MTYKTHGSLLYVDEKQSSSIIVQLDSCEIWLAFGVAAAATFDNWLNMSCWFWCCCCSAPVVESLRKLPVPEIICQLPTDNDDDDSWRWRLSLLVANGTDTGLVRLFWGGCVVGHEVLLKPLFELSVDMQPILLPLSWLFASHVPFL